MKTFEHVGSGEIFVTNLDLVAAFGNTFVELNKDPDNLEVTWDEAFWQMMVQKIEDGDLRQWRWDPVFLTNNKVYSRA
jgi:hypothetical protein